MSNLKAIREQIKELQAQAETIMATERLTVIAEIREKMNEFQLTFADFESPERQSNIKGGPRRNRISANPIAPKYRNSEGLTWTGRGITPRWMQAEIENGKTKEDFLIAPIKN